MQIIDGDSEDLTSDDISPLFNVSQFTGIYSQVDLESLESLVHYERIYRGIIQKVQMHAINRDTGYHMCGVSEEDFLPSYSVSSNVVQRRYLTEGTSTGAVDGLLAHGARSFLLVIGWCGALCEAEE